MLHRAAAGRAHRHEDRDGEHEREHEDARTDEARDSGEPVGRDLVVRVLAGVVVPLSVTGVRFLRAVRGRRIRRAGAVRGDDRQQAVDREAEQRQQRDEPEPARRRAVERVRGTACVVATAA